ncbi:MAG: HAD-IC family P-type ATPase [Bacilli bacterium]|nr:HAD-IC family P-type ATPase [Bacilli bacterium]
MEKKEKKVVNSNEKSFLDKLTDVPSESRVPVIISKEEKAEQRKAIKREKNRLKEEQKINKKRLKKGYIVKEEEIVRYFDVDLAQGLTSEIVEQRNKDGLSNVTDSGKGKTVPQIIFSNVFTFFNLLFLVIAVILILIGEFKNLIFLLTVLANLFIGIFQEIKAKKQIDKLSLLSVPSSIVIRDGEKIEIPIKDVVLDDIVLFTSGKQISTDCVVLEGAVEVNESLLTGESEAIAKQKGSTLYSGSFIVSGSCLARVDKVGSNSYIEKLANDAKKYKKPKSELLRTLNGILKVISIIIIPLGLMTWYFSFSNNLSLAEVFHPDNFDRLNKAIVAAAGSMVAMIPAGLFLLTTVALAVSVVRLAKQKTLVQELYCIEMLARVDILCLDKTGTITDGTMKVVDSVEINNNTDYTVREIVGSMMSAFEESNPTSDALVKFFDKNKVLTPVSTIPFSSKRKYSAVTFESEGTFVLGAPEFVLDSQYEKVKKRVERFSAQGNRVLALAKVTGKIDPKQKPKAAKVIALIAVQDHIREDASETIAYFKNNGVDIKVISGDNPLTVSEIASRAGVSGANRYISLDGMSDDNVRAVAFDYNIFGRVSPEQKKILVQTYKDYKKTVAMTGDGVNDILALKEADCSIAMASGSEATRYVAHLVLMDSNFASMPRVVAEGRRVINNIERTSTLFLVKTLFAILLTILYLILPNQNYPFAPNQMMIIEFCVIGIPAFFLALQPNTNKVTGRFLSNVIRSILPGAFVVLLSHLIIYFLGKYIPGFNVFLETGSEYAPYTTVTLYITTLIMFYVLYEVSKPLNLIRGLVISFMGITAVLLVVFFNDNVIFGFIGKFGFENLRLEDSLLVIVFLFAIPWLMKLVAGFFRVLRIIPEKER